MYQEKSSKLFLSRFPSQSLFAPLLCIGHCPLAGKENNFHSGTRCHVVGLCDGYFELAFLNLDS